MMSKPDYAIIIALNEIIYTIANFVRRQMMIDFSISQLKEFTTLVGTLSYSETAYRLNISPSALTRHIQSLERELGDNLFRRTTRTIELTDFGKAFLPHAVMLLQDYETGISAIETHRKSAAVTLHLGAYYSIAEYDIDKFIERYKTKYPEYTVSLTVGGMAELEKCFEEKLFNVYTAVDTPDVHGLKFLRVQSSVIKAVVSENSKFAECEKIFPADIASSSLLMPENNNPYSRKMYEHLKTAGITPNVVYSGRFEESIDFIRQSDSIGLFAFRADKPMHIPGLKLLPIEPELRFNYGVGYRDDLTAPEQAFLDIARSIIEEARR